VIKKQRASGLSVAEFCRRNDVSDALFYRWRRRLAESDAEETDPSDRGDREAAAQFIPIELPPPPAIAFEIVRPNGCRVLVPPGFEAADLREILRVLEELSC
jgi:transposase-like protein